MVELQKHDPTTTRLIELANDLAYAPISNWQHKRDQERLDRLDGMVPSIGGIFLPAVCLAVSSGELSSKLSSERSFGRIETTR